MPLAGTATDRGRFFPEALRLACDVRIRGFSAVGSGHGCRERFLSKAHRSRPVHPLPVSGHYPGEELRAALESRVQVLQESRAELRARAGHDLDAARSTRPGSAEVPPSMLVRPAAPPIAESRVNQPAYAAINTRRSAARPIATNRTHTVSPLLSAASQPGRYRAGLGRPGYIPCRRRITGGPGAPAAGELQVRGVAVIPGRQDVRAGRSERSGRFRAPGRGAREAGLLAGMGMPGLEPGTGRAHRLGRRA